MKSTCSSLLFGLGLLVAYTPGVFSSKPVHQFTITPGDLSTTLRLLLGDLWLQLDQTNDPSHTQNITSNYIACTPLTTAEKAACLTDCRNQFAGNPDMYKMCVAKCNSLQDCNKQCGLHATADFLQFGGVVKQFFQKTCNVTTDSCPRCTPGSKVPAVDDYDASNLVPSPIFTKNIGIGDISCTLTRFAIDLGVSKTPGYDGSVTLDFSPTQGIHLNIKAQADSPTMKCHGALSVDATLQNPYFDIFFKPSFSKHRVSWAVSASFHAHVDYPF